MHQDPERPGCPRMAGPTGRFGSIHPATPPNLAGRSTDRRHGMA